MKFFKNLFKKQEPKLKDYSEYTDIYVPSIQELNDQVNQRKEKELKENFSRILNDIVDRIKAVSSSGISNRILVDWTPHEHVRIEVLEYLKQKGYTVTKSSSGMGYYISW
jgi:oligoribonuclease (3'-5' exoribonuclease)